ncbi:MAG: ROK family transcriptional regulator [Phycisphaerales bacterium]|jgi:predicted NBD/HSP70 family sugar kinase|nr:ROK family transcriptional regulator [Phycisphaerales bacterium]
MTENISNSAVFDVLLSRLRTNVREVAQLLKISPSTVTGILSRLLKEGCVRREFNGNDERGRGRPAATFILRIDRPVAVCLFDGTQLTGAIVDSDLRLLTRDTRRVLRVESAEQARELITQQLENLLESTGMNRTDLPGMGLSVNAVPLEGRMLTSSVLPWADEQMEGQFSEALGLPVRLIPMSGLTAEYQAIPGPPPQSLVRFNVADGVSAHGMVAGALHPGSHGLGGEIGHVVQAAGGPLCGCGRRGCLEVYCSGPAICGRVIDDLRHSVSSSLRQMELVDTSPRLGIDAIHQAWLAGDSYARAMMEDVFERLGWAMGLVINLMDPDHVAISGYVLADKPQWIEEVVRRSQRWILHAARRRSVIVPARATLEDELVALACGFFYSRRWGVQNVRLSDSPHELLYTRSQENV